eukprot:8057297-Alexandrium_andersonii.AAC.1
MADKIPAPRAISVAYADDLAMVLERLRESMDRVSRTSSAFTEHARAYRSIIGGDDVSLAALQWNGDAGVEGSCLQCIDDNMRAAERSQVSCAGLASDGGSLQPTAEGVYCTAWNRW